MEEFVRRWKRSLAELEEAHVRAVYGPLEYSREQAEHLFETAGEVLRLAERIARRILGGGVDAA